jgi:hypothetical protein
VNNFCLQDNLLHHLSKPHFPSYREVHVTEEDFVSVVLTFGNCNVFTGMEFSSKESVCNH